MTWTTAQQVWAVEQMESHLALAHPMARDHRISTSADAIRCEHCLWGVLLTDDGACVVADGPFVPTLG